MLKRFRGMFIKKDWRGLLLKMAASVFIIAFIDFAVGKLFDFLYLHQKSGWEYRTRYSNDETKAAILIFGGSRAEHQYDPGIFEERLHESCFNVGRDGQSIFYHYAVLNSILKRYTPKLVILDFENGFLRKTQRAYDDLSTLFPFYKNHPGIRPIVELKGPYEKWKLLSGTYPYNSLFFNIVAGNTRFKKSNSDHIKGYLPLKMFWDKPISTMDFSEKYELDSNKIIYFKAFIDGCKKSKVKLLMVNSPCFYISGDAEEYSLTVTKKILKENNIDFLDYSKDELFLSNSRLFGNTLHVNIAGSEIFSNKLANEIISKSENQPGNLSSK